MMDGISIVHVENIKIIIQDFFVFLVAAVKEICCDHLIVLRRHLQLGMDLRIRGRVDVPVVFVDRRFIIVFVYLIADRGIKETANAE